MPAFHDIEYLNLLRKIYETGHQKGDRTGTGTVSLFSRQMRFDVSDGTIPLLTTKKMHHKSIVRELLWFLKGDTNIKYLQDNGVRIWNEWADSNGDLGPVYGEMWRKWPTAVGADINWETDPPTPFIKYKYVDQIDRLIKLLRVRPNDRRLLVSAWNPSLLPEDNKTFEENVANGKQALPPCHYAFQFYVSDKRLSLMLNQRSCDMFLGVPFNIAQYSILLHMVAQVTRLEPYEFIWNGGDCHIYQDHFEQVEEQLSRYVYEYPSPVLKLNPDVREIDDFNFEDFEVVGYHSYDTIKAKVSV